MEPIQPSDWLTESLIDRLTDSMTFFPIQHWFSLVETDLVVDKFLFASLWWWFPMLLNDHLSTPVISFQHSLLPFCRFPFMWSCNQSVWWLLGIIVWGVWWLIFECSDDFSDVGLLVKPVILTLWVFLKSFWVGLCNYVIIIIPQ